jgi:hypothetical protein
MSTIKTLEVASPRIKIFNIYALFFYPFIIPPVLLLAEYSPNISGFLLSFWLIAKFVYMPMVEQKKIDSKEWKQFIKDEKQNLPYHVKHPILVGLENTKTSPFNYITENTPDGLVIMRYNSDVEGFDYWSDFDIKYKNLEVVARKYTNTFNCGGIYKNKQALLKKKIDKIKEQIAENETDSKNETNSMNENKDRDNVFINQKRKPKTKLTKFDYVCDEANKYIKKGKFNEERGKHKIKREDIEGLSWNSWKNKIN